jgi:uncharacterized coiled-coil protein SlyX
LAAEREVVVNLQQMSTERLFNELDACIARLQSEQNKLRELLQRLIDNVESGNQEITGQCIIECKRELGLAA